LTITGSARQFDYDSTLDGFSGTVFWPCGGFGPQGDRPESNYGADCAATARTVTSKDEVYRASLEWSVTDDIMLYTTWGEGYRPGGLNRFCETRIPDGLGGQGNVNIGCAFESDILTAYELGFKSTLFDGRLRLNAAAFWQEWDDFQLSRLDTSISPITLTFNVGNAESNGVEFDFTSMITDNWTLSGAASFLDSTLTDDYRRSASSPEPDAPAGSRLPRVPELKWNLATRYTFANEWFAQAAYRYTGDSYNDLFGGFRQLQGSYDVVNASFGLERSNWTAELYVQNLTDERGEIWINDVNWDQRVTINQPRTIGFRWQQRF
jgi:outer membrane receptor protein involved in Fe transport